jgi:TolB-like protein/tetratricopeptide (TPR) repeat protein
MFFRSERLWRFLRFVVDRTLSGRGDELKGYLIGVEIYDKGPDFDPRLDSAVRVDARRLRAKLTEYYAGPGADRPIRIVLPKGGYQPEFAAASAAAVEVQPPQPTAVVPSSTRSWIPWALGGAVLFVMGAVVLWPSRADRAARASADIVRSIAVIPFVNLTGRAANDSLCTGLAEELNDRLSRARGLRVDALLSGSVREGSEALRITVQLVRGGDGSQVWSESFDLVKGDELGMQARIGHTIEQRIAGNLPRDAAFRPEISEEEQKIHNLVIQAGFLSQRRSRESLLKAIEYAERGAKAKPDYAPAYAVLGDAYLSLAGHETGTRRQECANQSRAHCQRALELNRSLGSPYASLASLKLFFEWNWAEAEDLFRQALARNPNQSVIHARYAQLLTFAGRHEEAEAQAQQAALLAPLSVLSFSSLGQADYYAGRYQEAVEHLRRALEVDPGYDPARQTTARALELSGDRRAAWAEVERMPKPYRESPEPHALVAWLLAREGKPAPARLSLAKATGASVISLAGAHAALGESKAALDLIEQALEARDPDMVFLKVSPVLDPLRSQPRFEELCRRVNLQGCVR